MNGDGTVTTKVTEFRGGVRLEQHGCVLSKILDGPGPTHSVFDVLAAAVVVFSPGPRMGMLGFAGGGMMAPLRAMGGDHEVRACDLADEGHALYRSRAAGWGGAVAFAREDARRWLRRQRRPFDALVEDLSVPTDGDVVKPAVSWTDLPRVMEQKLSPAGVSVMNLLPTPDVSWGEMIEACRWSTRPAVIVEFGAFFNRVMIQGEAVGEARPSGAMLRKALRGIGSRTAARISVKRVP